jgi:tetratricopeptide (TPR) repeat protein
MLFYLIYYKVQNPSLVNKVSKEEKATKQDIESAITKYMRRLKENPDDIEALKYLGGIFMQMEAWDKACFFLERGVKIAPHDSEFLINLATCYFFLKKYKDAAIYLERLLKIEPDNYMAKFNLAYLYGFVLKDKLRGEKLFLEIISRDNVPKNLKQKAEESLKELKTK